MRIIRQVSAALTVIILLTPRGHGQAEPRMLFNFGSGIDLESTVKGTDADFCLDGTVLSVRTSHTAPWPGINLKAPGGSWDLSSFRLIAMDLTNTGDTPVTINCRVDNPGADGVNNCITRSIALKPGESGVLRVTLSGPVRLTKPVKIIGMRGTPAADSTLDPSNIVQLIIFTARPTDDSSFTLDRIRAEGTVHSMKNEEFFPFIDEFGQFIHGTWPGKLTCADDFSSRIEAEKNDLDAHRGPSDRNAYGGWTSGPKLNATGAFRVRKYKRKWWLVDPEGRLFWSHGVDCVHSRAATPIDDREHYYRNLPGDGSPLAAFYGRSRWAPHGYYRDHIPFRTYDFARANLLRKYGRDWEKEFSALAHRRLKSWGLNTIANWSHALICRESRTPYTATLYIDAKPIQGSEGYWGQFSDVFDPDFRSKLVRQLDMKNYEAGDPWCIGFFVDNELGWGDGMSLAVAALTSPAYQPAKQAFIRDLKEKYTDIAGLNRVWGTTYTSWDSLTHSRTAPDRDKARADLQAFYTRLAETYFRIIRDELRKAAPDRLYLGCRFAWVNDRAVRAAARYCDVISFNKYTYSVADFDLPDDLDLPVVIGEFHFGALDRGMFHTGLRQADSQEHRAALYDRYVRGALANPHIVGTHWFQYKDQATTGRGDGENYQIGLVDMCDTPYPEMRRALRRLGNDMYMVRQAE